MARRFVSTQTLPETGDLVAIQINGTVDIYLVEAVTQDNRVVVTKDGDPTTFKNGRKTYWLFDCELVLSTFRDIRKSQK